MEVLLARARELSKRAGFGGVSNKTLVVAAIAAVLASGIALWQWWPQGGGSGLVGEGASGTSAVAATEPGGSRASGEPTAQPAGAFVHVVGAVRRPGVYEVCAGARVADAIAAAGGLLGSAAPAGVNLARMVVDGEQIRVPTQDEIESGGGLSGSPGTPGASLSGAGSSGPVNVNIADAALLDTLPGIGPSTAAKIVAEREANGPFASVDDLARVAGIGPKKLEGLRDLVVAR